MASNKAQILRAGLYLNQIDGRTPIPYPYYMHRIYYMHQIQTSVLPLGIKFLDWCYANLGPPWTYQHFNYIKYAEDFDDKNIRPWLVRTHDGERHIDIYLRDEALTMVMLTWQE